ncbi:MAG: hypothetical protein JSV65_15055 [Armatimonadota bacterium]|nr:MAG: hypothetical protein JSV65_15055 [Armatimonadota bacterium]
MADHFWIASRRPYEIEYCEGILLQNGVNIARGDEIYGDYTRYPYVAATYPPAYPAILSLGMKAFGVSFAFRRAASLAVTLGIGPFI